MLLLRWLLVLLVHFGLELDPLLLQEEADGAEVPESDRTVKSDWDVFCRSVVLVDVT